MTAKKCTTKSVMHVQIWCFATVNLLLFGLSSCRRRPLGSLLKSLSNDDGDGNLNVIKGFCMCIRHTSDTFLAVTALLRSSQSIWKKLPYSGVLWRTLAQDDDILRFFLWSWSGGGIVQLQQIFPRFETSRWNNSDQVWNSASSIF